MLVWVGLDMDPVLIKHQIMPPAPQDTTSGSKSQSGWIGEKTISNFRWILICNAFDGLDSTRNKSSLGNGQFPRLGKPNDCCYGKSSNPCISSVPAPVPLIAPMIGPNWGKCGQLSVNVFCPDCSSTKPASLTYNVQRPIRNIISKVSWFSTFCPLHYSSQHVIDKMRRWIK